MFQSYEYYQNKEWKGLDPEFERPVEKAVLGKIGIASAYTKLEPEEE
jgi:hypothetical protein